MKINQSGASTSLETRPIKIRMRDNDYFLITFTCRFGAGASEDGWEVLCGG